MSEQDLELIASKQMLSNKVVGKIDYKKLINNRKRMLFAFDKKFYNLKLSQIRYSNMFFLTKFLFLAKCY